MPPRKALILGLDAITPELVERFVAEGRLPNIAKLIERGVFARPMPCLPTHTAVNWTTIGTGAWPGTHGITGFTLIEKGKPLSEIRDGFNTDLVEAKFLWTAAEEVGKRSLLLKWAGPTYPVTVRSGAQVDGCFCVTCPHEICGPRGFSTHPTPGSAQISFRPASQWANMPASQRPALETSVELGAPDELLTFHDPAPSKFGLEERDPAISRAQAPCVTVHVLCLAVGSDYDTIILSRTKDAADKLGCISQGEWSDWLRLPFPKPEGEQLATLRLKLIRLAADASQFHLFCSQIMPVSGWTYPEALAEELVDAVGPFLQRPGFIQRGLVYGGWADCDTMIEEMAYQDDWYARAASYLMKKEDFDLLFLQTHSPDYVQDSLMPDAEPLTAEHAEHAARDLEYIARTYESCDRMVGRILDELVDEETLVVVVSDHGCIGAHSDEQVSTVAKKILIDKGLLVYKEHGARAIDPGSKPRVGVDEVDWSKTKAVFQDSIYIFLNVRGREPNGVLDPSEYDTVRDEIIEALRQHKDPRLGKCPFLVFRSEDAAMLGLYGNRVGDIIVAMREGVHYGEGHGSFVPTARYGLSSVHATLIMSGPGVKQNYTIERPIWLTDVAPTIAHLMGIPAPDTMEGAILNDALSREPV